MIARALVAATLVLGVVASADAQEFHVRHIVGTGDQLPGAPAGTTINYPFAPAAAGRWVVFGAISSIGRGLYAWDGVDLHRIIDQTMELPGIGSVVPYPDGGRLDVDAGGNAAFYGESPFSGIWRWSPGEGLRLIVRVGEESPIAAGETVLAVDTPRVVGADTFAVVERSDPGNPPFAIEVLRFAGDGAVSVVAADAWVRFAAVGPTVAFGSGPDLMTRVGTDPPKVLLRPGDPFPDGVLGETWLGSDAHVLEIGHGGVLVRGQGSSGTLAYVVMRDRFDGQALVRNGDPEPHTGLPITALFGTASETRFAFLARPQGQSELYLSVRNQDGTFLPILAPGDIVDGEAVGDIELTRKGFAHDNRLTFVLYQQSRAGLWVAEFGTPSPLEIPSLDRLGLAALIVLLALAGLRSLILPNAATATKGLR